MIVFDCFTDYSLWTVVIRLHIHFTDCFFKGVLVFVITKTKRGLCFHLNFAGAHLQMNTTLLPKSTSRNVKLNKFCIWSPMTTGFIMYALIYVISGISVPESQTFLLAKRPSTAMSEEKRLSLAGFIIIWLCWTFLCDHCKDPRQSEQQMQITCL